MEKKKIVKVSMSGGWTAFFVSGLYRSDREQEKVYDLVEADNRPILMDAHDNEVLDFREFDWWWERAYQCAWKCTQMDGEAINSMIRTLLNGSDVIGKCVLSSGNAGETTIEATDEPIEFNAEFITQVKKVNNGQFLDVPYKSKTMNLASFKAAIDRIAKEHPELLDKPVKVEEYWDADEEIQDVYGVDAEDGYVLIY